MFCQLTIYLKNLINFVFCLFQLLFVKTKRMLFNKCYVMFAVPILVSHILYILYHKWISRNSFFFGWIQLIFVCFNKHRILHARRICEWFTLWWSVAIMRTRFVQNYNNWIMLLCICSYFYCNMMICTAVYAISISSSLLISLNDFDLTIIELRQQKRVASRRLLRT